MEDIKKITGILKDKGYVTRSMVAEMGLNPKLLEKMANDKEIVKIARGTYQPYNAMEDILFAKICNTPSAVYSHATALYFHNFSDRTPIHFDITVPQGYNGKLQEDKNVDLHYVKREYIDLGVITVTSPFGLPIRIYDLERTICDIIKKKHKMDIEIFTKALKQYAKHKGKNSIKLYDYAKKFNVDKKLREYLEVLI
ncbi:MAG: abortive phage infection protein [Oscillospiraceae bacterium]|nr:abortive phage infection protein [Oscillospiraceae bacterium]